MKELLGPGGVLPIIERVETFLAQVHCFPKLEADRASLEILLAQVKAKQASLETPLRVLLLGGTGVGKSSVMNALAMDEIAQVAATRPTTRQLTAYFHKKTGSSSLGRLEAQAKLVPHERATLEDKIVVDAPDFDSTVHENKELLERALESTDLALVVVTPEKYMAHELFSLLEKYRDGVQFVFVLNKCDRGEFEEVKADLRREVERRRFRDPRVFAVSALRARKGEPAQDWSELLALLERELDRVRIREIKAAKLQDRVRALLERVNACVPSDSPKRLEKWRVSWRSTIADLTADLGEQFFGALRSDFELRNVLAYLFGTSLGGIFGVFMTAVYGVRSVLQPGFSRARRLTSHELDELLGERLRAVDPGAIERRVALVFERFEDEGRTHGFSAPELAPLTRAGLPASTTALVAAVRKQASHKFYEVFEETLGSGRRGARTGRFGWNVVPFAVVMFCLYTFVHELAAQGAFNAVLLMKDLPGFVQSTLVAYCVACLLEWPIAERVIQRRVAKSFELLEGVVAAAVQECLGEAILQRPEKALEEIAARFKEWDSLEKDAKRVLVPDDRLPEAPRRATARMQEMAPEVAKVADARRETARRVVRE
jgi:GTP-binding protein EngB required for normal cell division